jgi:hypothetical protein
MAAQALVLVTRTDDGTKFKVSANKIVQFKAQGANTLLEYVDQRGKKVQTLVTTSVSDINTAAARTQAVTLYPSGITLYINSDRIIYIHSQTWGSRITYDISGNRGKYNQPPEFIDCTQSGATINTAAVNTGKVIPDGGKEYWINGDLIDLVVKDPSYGPSNIANYLMLYDARGTEFEKKKLSSATSYLAISTWS